MTDIRKIQKIVAERYGISMSEMMGRRRFQEFSWPRHVAMYFSRKLTGRPLEEIALKFRRHHADVIYAVMKIESEIGNYNNVKLELWDAEESIKRYLVREAK